MKAFSYALLIPLLLPACRTPEVGPGAQVKDAFGDSSGEYLDLNHVAGTQVLYEVQVRSANACREDMGANWQKAACKNKLAPKITYRAEGMSCGIIDELRKIKLGTLEDMTENTADRRNGITLRYVKEKVGATAVWLMPLFPNNDQWKIPDECDDLGSPYAVRDYLHVQGTLSRSCIQQGKDEHSSPPCFGNDSLDALIQKAHAQGTKIILDVALNHFGHNYLMYDYEDYKPVRDRIEGGEDLARLWNFEDTHEGFLEKPRLLDTVQRLEELASTNNFHKKTLAALKLKCPTLSGQPLLHAYHMWREALDWERAQFPCGQQFLEFALPGFYMGQDATNPAKKLGDNFTNNWKDVKFLFHKEANGAHTHEFVRNREYFFRILNYWVSRGVDGFRLDHTTDKDSGMAPNEWRYLLTKVNHYAQKRGQARPLYLAEEFGDQMGMNKVVDMMTEGYLFDMVKRGGGDKDTGHVERVLSNMGRFGGHTYVMTALETHDEHRLTDGTGFGTWTGAGFWAIGATRWSTPMLLMGQEFGEPWGVGFRRSDLIRGRFEGSANWNPEGDKLTDYYRAIITARLDAKNRALYASPSHFLRPKPTPDRPDARLFAQMKWSEDTNVVFTFHNLWEEDVQQSFFIPPEVASAAQISDGTSYKLVNVLANQQAGPCRTGAELKWELPVVMGRGTRFQWLRLETCQ